MKINEKTIDRIDSVLGNRRRLRRIQKETSGMTMPNLIEWLIDKFLHPEYKVNNDDKESNRSLILKKTANILDLDEGDKIEMLTEGEIILILLIIICL
jgi:hypothetical protein